MSLFRRCTWPSRVGPSTAAKIITLKLWFTTLNGRNADENIIRLTLCHPCGRNISEIGVWRKGERKYIATGLAVADFFLARTATKNYRMNNLIVGCTRLRQTVVLHAVIDSYLWRMERQSAVYKRVKLRYSWDFQFLIIDLSPCFVTVSQLFNHKSLTYVCKFKNF